MRNVKQENRDMKLIFKKVRLCLGLAVALLAGFTLDAQQVVSLSVEVKYDSVLSLDGKYFAVKLNGKWGVEKEGHKILDCRYDYIDALGDDAITFVENGKAGFADLDGKILVEPTYPTEAPLESEDKTQLNLFLDGGCVVWQNGELELINTSGQRVIGDSLEVVSRVGEAIVVKKEGLYGMVNAKGEYTVEPQFLSLQTLVAGKLYAYQVFDRDNLPVFGLVGANGKILARPQFAEFLTYTSKRGIYVKGFTTLGNQALFSENGDLLMQPLYSVIEPTEQEDFFSISENFKKGIIGRDYVVYVEPKYEDVRIWCGEDTLFIASDGVTSYVIDKKNTVVASIEGIVLDIVKSKTGELLLVCEQDLSYGLYRTDGTWKIEPTYDEVLGVVGQSICFRKAKRWGAVDFEGRETVPFKYSKAKLSQHNTIAAFLDGGKTSILLCKDGTVREFPKSETALVYGDYVEYKVGKEKERLYADGRKIPHEFVTIGSDKDGVLCAKTSEGWGWFDSKTFKPLSDKRYDYVSGFVGDISFAAKGDRLIVLDKSFNEIQSLTLPQGVDVSSVASILAMYRIRGKASLIVRNVKEKKSGVITINQ